MHKYSIFSHNWLALKLQNEGFQKMKPNINGVTLDLGCGSRPFKSEIDSCCTLNIGIDWPNSPHRFSANIAADLTYKLPIRKQSVDTVVLLEVLEHIQNPAQLLAEIHEILKPKGRIVMSTPFQWREHEKPFDYYRYTRFGLCYILETAGFDNIQIVAKSGVWVTIALKINYQLARLTPRNRKSILGLVFFPIFFTNQILAFILDKIWPGDGETIGYFATAYKP